jgi:hypothetical protein
MSNPNDQALPLAEGDPVNNVVGMPPIPKGGNTHGASMSHQAHGRGDESSDSDVRSSMMQGPTAPLDDHQGTILEPLSITLSYPLTIHRVLATLGR